MNVIDAFNAAQCKSEIPAFRVGDTVRVHQRISEGGRERIQVFEGVVIGRKGGSGTETFTVRRISFGVGVERIFPLHSPKIEQIEVVALGKVRRAKLYYLRDRVGKAARVKSKTVRKSEEEKKADRKVKKAKKAEAKAAKDEAKAANAEAKAEKKSAKRAKKATKKKAAKAASKTAK